MMDDAKNKPIYNFNNGQPRCFYCASTEVVHAQGRGGYKKYFCERCWRKRLSEAALSDGPERRYNHLRLRRQTRGGIIR